MQVVPQFTQKFFCTFHACLAVCHGRLNYLERAAREAAFCRGVGVGRGWHGSRGGGGGGGGRAH